MCIGAKEPSKPPRLAPSYGAWAPSAQRPFVDTDEWRKPSDEAIGALLKFTFSVKAIAAQAQSLTKQLLGEPSRYTHSPDGLYLEMPERILAQQSSSVCCRQSTTELIPLDFLYLAVSIGSNSFRGMTRFQIARQGRPARAMDAVNGIAPLLNRHPKLTAYRPMTTHERSERRPALRSSHVDAYIAATCWRHLRKDVGTHDR
jgi:hypothetical protein